MLLALGSGSTPYNISSKPFDVYPKKSKEQLDASYSQLQIDWVV